MRDTVTDTLPANDLVQQAQRGEIAAFEALYRAHLGRVYGLCLRLAGDAGKAEELTQDVFVRVWEKLSTFRGESAFSTWLQRLAVNLACDRVRSESRRSAWILSAGDLAPYDRGHRDPALPERLDLEKAIALLPAGARAAFVLHDIEGYRHEEIAKLTGMAQGTSKSQLHRARRFLREVLER